MAITLKKLAKLAMLRATADSGNLMSFHQDLKKAGIKTEELPEPLQYVQETPPDNGGPVLYIWRFKEPGIRHVELWGFMGHEWLVPNFAEIPKGMRLKKKAG